jgi:type I restriction enzyme R subunit
MLDAEIRIRLDEDEDVRPLSERLQRIIDDKRAGTLAGIALLNELEALAEDVIEIVEEEKRPVRESIAKEAARRLGHGRGDDANAVADAIVARADELCFPGWISLSHMDNELYRELTILLATTFKDFGLHGAGKDFVDRVVRILRKARFKNELA